jgi:preprotein translocase subunit SecG
VLVALVTALHLLIAVALIGLVLLHRGQGGGISDMFGGGMGAVQGSAVAERNLTRLTVISVVLFAITSVTLLVIA